MTISWISAGCQASGRPTIEVGPLPEGTRPARGNDPCKAVVTFCAPEDSEMLPPAGQMGTSLILAVAVFAGGQIGSRISVRLDKKRLKKGFVVEAGESKQLDRARCDT